MKIRDLRTKEEFLEAEEVQKTVWDFPDREIIPLNELIVVQKHGGCVFGAFENGRMIAFCFGMPAYNGGKAYHYSRMLGVMPGYQDRGLGTVLKLEQRKRVLKQGLNLVKWTFDPLQSRNAALNIAKLGCVVREYLVNLYPASASRFNRGLEADRVVPEWWIAGRHVKDALAGRRKRRPLADYAPAIETAFNAAGWVAPLRRRPARGRFVSVEIPGEIDRLKDQDLELAQTWRVETREVFLSLFRKGCVVHDFVGEVVEGRRRNFYLLEKGFRVR